MSAFAHEARAGLAVIGRNFTLVRRYLEWEIVFLFYNVVNVFTIGLIAYETPARGRPEVIVYLSIGALLWGLLSVLFQEVANSVSMERWEGTVEYTFMAPMRRVTYLLGTSIYAVAYGMGRSAFALAAVILFFHIRLGRADLAGAALAMLVSCVPFIGLGLVAAVLPLLSTERGAQATQIIQGLMLLVSGVYYPIRVLPGWIRWLGEISPATYTLDAERAALLHGASLIQLGPEIVRLMITGALLVPLGLLVFSWGERYALRHGKLKRNG